MEVAPGEGDIQTREHFGDVQLHVEFATPAEVRGDSQGRGNSGVFLMGRYEFQVLDCYDNPTYADGTTGAIYGQYPPLVNACRRPGEWQTYDIVWLAPRFEGERLVTPAYATVILNGVVVQYHRELLGGTDPPAPGAVHPSSPHRAPEAAGPPEPDALPQHLVPAYRPAGRSGLSRPGGSAPLTVSPDPW